MNPMEIPFEISRRHLLDHDGLLPRATEQRILGWIRARRLPELASLGDLVDPALHGSSQARLLRQLASFFKKNELYADSSITESTAISAFINAEVKCAFTNLRLDSLCDQPLSGDLALWVSRAEKYISECLGEFAPFAEEIPKLVRLTNGATRSLSRRNAIPALKLQRTVEATTGSVPYLRALRNYFGYSGMKFLPTDLNRVEVVPKNWKTARTIACEPTGSVPLQLAFDEYVKGRLRKKGIDLSDQGRNQQMAFLGSINGAYATVDMAMASDTIAYNVVALLFPTDWFRYLDAIRSKEGCLPNGMKVRYNKFSSMGNGSTFAIETLVFAAMCYAVDPKQDFSVYGDDIVIEGKNYADLKRFSDYLGFEINQEKSFTEGPFRESCGTDWWQGENITPFYLRHWRKSKARLCHNVNGLVSIAKPEGLLWQFCLGVISENELPLVPFSENTMSGVHIDITSAYKIGVIRFQKRTGRQRVKQFTSKAGPERIISDSRGLFLWYLRSMKLLGLEEGFSGVREERISSSVLLSSTHYARRWVYWIPPVARTPAHLFWWSDYVLAEARA